MVKVDIRREAVSIEVSYESGPGIKKKPDTDSFGDSIPVK